MNFYQRERNDKFTFLTIHRSSFIVHRFIHRSSLKN